MSKQSPASPPGAAVETSKGDRGERLKAALKANLARRKEQAKQKQGTNEAKPAKRDPET